MAKRTFQEIMAIITAFFGLLSELASIGPAGIEIIVGAREAIQEFKKALAEDVD